MRNLHELNQYRLIDIKVYEIYGEFGDDKNGAFIVPYKSDSLKVLASSGEGWDHVSVSMRKRIPNWMEMEYIAKLFFKDDEIAIQYHVPRKEHINIMENCLHWWRPWVGIPMPPPIFV
jgi:hypothetical protein